MTVLARLKSAVVSSIAIGSLVATASLATAQEGEAVNIAGLLGTTGPLVSIDVPSAEGFKLAVKQINDAGGIQIDGQKHMLNAEIFDIQGKPDQAVGMARKIVSEGEPKIIVGPIASSVSVPTLPITQPNVLHLSPSTIVQKYVGQPGNELLFNTTNPQFGETGISPKYAKWVVENIAKPNGIKKIAVLLPNDALGQLDMETFPPAFEKMGLEITGSEMFDPKSPDFSALITKLKGGQPDALFWGYLDEAGKTIIRQSLELGLTKRFISAPGSSGGAVGDQADKIEFAVWPSVISSIYNPSEKMRAFVSAYEDQVGREINAGDQFALYLYDPTFMIAKAMENAGTTTDVNKIAEALRGMNYSGLMNYSVDEKGQFHSDWDIGMMSQGGEISWTTIKNN